MGVDSPHESPAHPTEAIGLCSYLETHVRREEVQASCPGGSVVIGGVCTAESVSQLAQLLGPDCALRVGEYVACEAAARESPCSIDFMRIDLPECEAVNRCLASQAGPDEP